MRAYLLNQFGPVIVTLLAAVAAVYFAYDARVARDAADLARVQAISPPPAVVESCLMLTMPVFKDLSLGGVIFDEGVCSEDSRAPVCEICGDDLSRFGRIKLLQLVGKQLVEEGK